MQRALSAPGKLFVSGEYAVLWGGVARVAAVGPRAQALVRQRQDSEVHLVLAEGRLRGRMTPLGVHWAGPVEAPFVFAARAVDELVRAHQVVSLGFSLALSPSVSPVPGQKLGLGGSARAAVLAAEAARFILEDRLDPLKAALVAHAEAQGLKGSGADVVACFAGGLVRYRRFPVESVLQAGVTRADAYGQSPPVDLVRVTPGALWAVYAFSGQSASTPRLIEQAERRLRPAERERFVARSDGLGDLLERALGSGNYATVVEAVDGLRELLASLGQVETEGTRRIVALAKSHGCVAKVSGAGGGDGCLAFCPGPDHRRELLQALGARGLHAFPVELEPGLRSELEPDPLLAGWLSSGPP